MQISGSEITWKTLLGRIDSIQFRLPSTMLYNAASWQAVFVLAYGSQLQLGAWSCFEITISRKILESQIAAEVTKKH